MPEPQRSNVQDFIISYLATHQQQDGLWWSGDPYNRLSGAFKVSSLYARWNRPMPQAETIKTTVLSIITSDRADHACFVRNALHLQQVLARDCAFSNAEIQTFAQVSIRNIRQFQRKDGGFATHEGYGTTDGCSQAMKVRDAVRKLLGLPEKPFPGAESYIQLIRNDTATTGQSQP